jgi:hypothetical protein
MNVSGNICTGSLIIFFEEIKLLKTGMSEFSENSEKHAKVLLHIFNSYKLSDIMLNVFYCHYI